MQSSWTCRRALRATSAALQSCGKPGGSSLTDILVSCLDLSRKLGSLVSFAAAVPSCRHSAWFCCTTYNHRHVLAHLDRTAGLQSL